MVILWFMITLIKASLFADPRNPPQVYKELKSMAKKDKDKDKHELNNFDMTLEECRAVFDTFDNLVIVDANGYLKYLSPDMYPVIEAYNKKPIPDSIVGKHISEIHPASKILNAFDASKNDDIFFYFASNVTNIARIKPVKTDGKITGAIDYDYFTDGPMLNAFVDKLIEYHKKGFINLQDTFQSMLAESRSERTIKYVVTDIVGNSPAIRQLRMQIGRIAESDSTVLITGKTGCGKELIAHSIHNLSLRCKKKMVEINCAAIPDALFESELFGYVGGAFTGAKRDGRKGSFELADNSTIFLDEVDQLPLHVQPKLLRVLQEREVTRIGGTPKPIDIRVIAATNKDLWALVKDGSFREDLYYRLNVIELNVPSLKERRDDIPQLVDYQLQRLNRKMSRNIAKVSDEVLEAFMNYDWPGNVRELNNIIEHAVNVCSDEVIGLKDLGSFIQRSADRALNISFNSDNPLEDVRNNAEREAIKAALRMTDNNRSQAAALLKISRTALYDKINKLGL